MRKTVHDSIVRFRVNANLVASAETVATQRGMSLSELMRDALRKELGAK